MNYLHFKLLLIVLSALGAHAASGMQECKERKATAEAAAETKQAVETKTAADASSADAKSSAQAQGEITVVKIHIPEDISKKGAEELQLDEDESLTYETFRELINKQAKTGDSFILARVVSQKSGDETEFVHYYDAHTLNRHIFGNTYAATELAPFVVQKDTNPLNKLHIKRVDYFACSADKLSKGFIHMCSDHALLFRAEENPHMVQLYANQNVNLELKKIALKKLLEKFVVFCRNKEYALALPLIHQVSCQTTDLAAQAEARAWLGMLYYHDLGVEEDHQKALELLEPLTKQTHNLLVQVEAFRYVGQIYHDKKNYKTALEYLMPAAEQTISPGDQANACVRIGSIYLNGDGVPQDCSKAIPYLIQAALQTVAPIAQALALRRIGLIYYLGDDQIKKNFALALEYFTKAMESPHAEVEEYHVSRSNIGLIYYHGGHGVEKDHEKALHYFKGTDFNHLSNQFKQECIDILKDLESRKATITPEGIS